jgi:hypothetical protein
MRIMLDRGIFIHSEFAEVATQDVPVSWGKYEYVTKITGLIRKELRKDDEQQRQAEALFTVGRLIREEKIEAYTYIELTFEQVRGKFKRSRFNALENCDIRQCCPAIERSRFFSTTNPTAAFEKGGKKDRRRGIVSEGVDQIASIEFLLSLSKESVEALIPYVPSLSQFEIESLRNIQWFQLLCELFAKPEDYPDALHLWTAERNSIDAFLTLDTKLQNKVSKIRSESKCPISINAQVLQPLELLQKFGIYDADPVPMEPGQFYRLF